MPKIPFEKTLNELEEIVKELEKGELSLDDSLKSYEKGIKLARLCQKTLKDAEQTIEILHENPIQDDKSHG